MAEATVQDQEDAASRSVEGLDDGWLGRREGLPKRLAQVAAVTFGNPGRGRVRHHRQRLAVGAARCGADRDRSADEPLVPKR